MVADGRPERLHPDARARGDAGHVRRQGGDQGGRRLLGGVRERGESGGGGPRGWIRPQQEARGLLVVGVCSCGCRLSLVLVLLVVVFYVVAVPLLLGVSWVFRFSVCGCRAGEFVDFLCWGSDGARRLWKLPLRPGLGRVAGVAAIFLCCSVLSCYEGELNSCAGHREKYQSRRLHFFDKEEQR